ncbi:FtsX-like permease family protein [Jatrophihabitans fulvus]
MSAAPARRASWVVLSTSALGAAQSAAIVTQVGAVGDAVGGTVFAAGPMAAIVLTLLSGVFVAVAMTVTAVAVTGATEIVLVGRLREIALRRLLGASAADERDRVVRSVLRRALAGMVAGAVVGHLVSIVVLAATVGPSDGLQLSGAAYLPSPLLLIALLGQYAATHAAVRRGARGVLLVRPAEALRRSGDADAAVARTLAVPPRASAGVLGLGLALLIAAVLVSRSTPLAMLPALAGGIVTFVGVVSYGPRIVPRLASGTALLLPRTPGFVQARRAMVRHPERSSRAVLGVAAAVAVVTTFVVGVSCFDAAVAAHYEGSAFQGLATDVRDTVVRVVLVLACCLGLTAAVALGNAIGFETWARRRETALFRILGRTGRQTRTVVLAHSVLVGTTATVLGVVLGLGFGWAGAQSVGGTLTAAPVPFVVPWPVLAATALVVGAITVLAAALPVRDAVRLPPMRAYLAP